MAGMAGSEVATLGPNPKTSKGAGVGEIVVGAARFGRASEVKNPQVPEESGKKGGCR